MNRKLAPIVLVCLLSLGVVMASGEPAPGESEKGLSLKDAIQITVERQLSIQEAQVDVAFQKARLKQARGAFDRTLSISLGNTINRGPFTLQEQGNFNVSHFTTQNYPLQIGLARQNRSGVKIIPNLQFSGTQTSPNAYSRSPELLGQGGAHFTLIAPLGRGRKNDLNAATEKSATMDVDATTKDASFQVCRAIYQTTTAYWNLQAAEDRLESQMQAEKRNIERIEKMKKVSPASNTAPADNFLAEADLADSQADILTAQQAVIEARSALGLAMGLSAEQVSVMGSATTRAFEEDLPPDLKPPPVEELIRAGLAQRHDLAALMIRKKSAENMLPALVSQTRPRLDLNLDVGYNGLTEGGSVLKPAESLYRGTAGLNSSFNMSYEFPLENRAASGNLQQQKETVNRLRMQTEDLIRSIRVNIQTAFREAHQQYKAILKLTEVISKFRNTLEDEEKKQKAGQAALLDTLNVDDRLIAAENKLDAARQGLALALARLQFECGGTYLSLGQDGTISIELYQQPIPQGAENPQGGKGK